VITVASAITFLKADILGVSMGKGIPRPLSAVIY